MPKARSDAFYNEEKAFTIFVFLDQLDDGCFIWKTSNTNLKMVFEKHYFLGHTRTKLMFEKGKSVGKPPEMYVLSHVFCTEAVAFKHCIAWTKFFMNHGYDSKNNEVHKGYTEYLDDDTQQIYNKIKELFLSDVCNPERKLFDDYGKIRKKRDPEEAPSIISITLNKEEYEKIKKSAEGQGLTPAAYVKKMAIDGEIKIEDYSFFLEYKDSLRVIERQIKGILQTIYETGKYDPKDLENIQRLCDETGEVHRDAMKIFNKRKYGKRTKRK